MKKILHSGLAIGIAASVFLGCSRQENVPPLQNTPKPDISVDDNMLVFKSRAIYENYNHSLDVIPEKVTIEEHLAKKENALNFLSMRAASKGSSKSGRTMADQGVEDDYLGSMLNPDGMIQIGAWIFKIDIPHEKVFALHEKYKSAALASLKKGDTSHDKVKVFSTNEDVLLILEAEGENATSSGGRVNILCFREGGAASRKDGDEPTFGDPSFRLDCKLVYQKAGVYFSIQAKAQLQRQVLGIWYASIGCIDGSYGGEWKVKCGDWGSDFGSGGNRCGNFGEDGSSWNHRLYESASGLNRYRASVAFSASSLGGNLNTRTYFISDRW